MRVRAKFRVTKVEHWDGDSHTAHLSVVVGGSDENKQFFKYTPGGQIQLNTLNAAAAEQFVPGKEFYVDFTPAEAPAQ